MKVVAGRKKVCDRKFWNLDPEAQYQATVKSIRKYVSKKSMGRQKLKVKVEEPGI